MLGKLPVVCAVLLISVAAVADEWLRSIPEFELRDHLGAVHTINRIRIFLYDLDNRRYGFRVFVSEDGASWNQVRSNPRARGGWQEIGVEDTKLQFIRVNGLSNTENRNFHVVEIEAYGS